MTLPDEVLALLEQPVFAFVATTFPSGQPQSAPVWITVVDGRPLFNTAVGRVKERNLRRDPRLSLSFLTLHDPEEYVELRGHRRVQPGRGRRHDRRPLAQVPGHGLRAPQRVAAAHQRVRERRQGLPRVTLAA